MDELLKNKTAVVYGAGAIGSAVARAFAKAGAAVFVADHNAGALQKLAGARIQTAQVDVLDKDAVAAFVQSVAEKTGRVDVSFCATSTHRPGGDQGAALSELSYEDFSMPLIDYTKAHFNATNAASPYMIQQGSGVIMGITAIPSQMPFPYTAGFGPACVPSACVRPVRRARRTKRLSRPHRKLRNVSRDGANAGQAVIFWARRLH
jgi:3-oxoacyl-[acyl-carrier protein] reductase